MSPAFGVSLMPETAFAAAALPLFEDDLVEVVEWSFDLGWGPTGVPDWLDALLDDFAATGDLIGHGVSYSVLAGAATDHDARWLEGLRRETARRTYRHVSEHLGFVGAGRFSFAAPLPMPHCDSVLEVGRRRLAAMAEAAEVPIGLENLATALGPADAAEQGGFLAALLEPTDGFVVLDLHNLWCHVVNLGSDPEDLLAGYPLDRVREIHLSGGSWDGRAPGRRLRRDTHDGLVPDEVLELLDVVAPRCPMLEVVIHERLGTTLADPDVHQAYRDDVRRVRDRVAVL